MDTVVLTQGAGLEEYLEPWEVADIIRCNKYTLARMRVEGRGPTYLKIGHRTVIYRRRDVDAWMAKHARVTEDIDLDALGLGEPGEAA